MSEPRVAPTAKIPDDAPFQAPAPSGYAVSHAAGPISYAPPSMPPRMPSTPPPVDAPPPARVPEASLSMPIPRRRTGLIATVVVIDLALAAAGAVLLMKGLEPAKAPPAPQSSSIAMPPPPAPAPTPPPVVQPAAGSGSGLDAIGSALEHLADTQPPPPPPAPTPHAATKKPAPPPPAPVDPYDTAHALTNEVELAASRAGPDFERCHEREHDIHGAIHISFVVVGDGRVASPKVTQNTTGSTTLATCLTTIISGWTFASHPAHATSFVRPFSYP